MQLPSGKIFLTGATGFVGSQILRALLAEGHHVRASCRQPERQKAHRQIEWIEGDFSKDQDPELWKERLRGCDAVINSVGIITETSKARFEDLHTSGPIALFQAASELNISRVIQISALGADERGTTAYHRTKFAADQELLRLIPQATVLRPSLIMGKEGKSTKLFATLAALPVVPLPGKGDFALQPVFIGDLTSGVLHFLSEPAGGRVDVTGPHPLSYKQMLDRMAESAGLRPLFVSVPMFLIRRVAGLGIGPLTRDTLAMLERGNTADQVPFAKATGIKLKEATDLPALGLQLTDLILPALWPLVRVCISFLWIWTGIVSLFFFSQEQSFEWLRAVGLPERQLLPALVASSVIDILLGVLLFSRLRSLSYGIQLITVLFYTIVLTFALPDMWLHPFGPASKNLPLLALTALAWIFDRRKYVSLS